LGLGLDSVWEILGAFLCIIITVTGAGKHFTGLGLFAAASLFSLLHVEFRSAQHLLFVCAGSGGEPDLQCAFFYMYVTCHLPRAVIASRAMPEANELREISRYV